MQAVTSKFNCVINIKISLTEWGNGADLRNFVTEWVPKRLKAKITAHKNWILTDEVTFHRDMALQF